MILQPFAFAYCASRYVGTFRSLQAFAMSKPRLRARARNPRWKIVAEQLSAHGASFVPPPAGRMEFMLIEAETNGSVAVWEGLTASAAPTEEQAKALGASMSGQPADRFWRADRFPLGRLT